MPPGGRRWNGGYYEKEDGCVFGSVHAALRTGAGCRFSNLVIIHTNDTHGFDRRAEGINGMATVSALRKHYLSQGKDVLLVDAGDAIQDNNLVNFSKGKSAIAFMNAAGYDAMALGNHEFDYGQEVLAERIREAKFPMLSANVIVEATGRPLTRDSVIYKKGM